MLSDEKDNNYVGPIPSNTNAYVIICWSKQCLAVFVPLKEQISNLNQIIDCRLFSHIGIFFVLGFDVCNVEFGINLLVWSTMVIFVLFQ